MLRFLLTTLIALTLTSVYAQEKYKQKLGDWETLKLTNDKPTEVKDFAAALPIGNGRLGAKVFGGVAAELLTLNETTLWSGEPTNGADPKVRELFLQVRQAREFKKADDLARKEKAGEHPAKATPVPDGFTGAVVGVVGGI